MTNGEIILFNAIEKLREENKLLKNDLGVKNIGDVSDGSHTFNELYYHRMMLFSVVCNTYKAKAWKSWKHEDGTMFDNYFIVGVRTPQGDYSYHYSEEYWDMFHVIAFENAPKWDGHQPKDIDRLCSLVDE